MVKRSQEDAAKTRSALLAAAFEEIYKYGFQAASVANIVKRTHLTKGAFFHHFPDKKSLGYAVVDEVIAEMIRSQWVAPLLESRDPLATIADEFEKGIDMLAQAPVNLGCPLNNLAQEMSPVDEGFRRRTADVFAVWVDAYAAALARGKKRGVVARRVRPRDTGVFLVAQIEGILSLAKTTKDPGVMRSGAASLRAFLQSLKPSSSPA